MRLVVLNCNTSTGMTERIGATARGAASSGTDVIVIQPHWGPESVEGYYDGFVGAAAMLDRMTVFDEPIDGLVIAGFGEHGREGLRELLDVPVVDIAEAAAVMALLIGPRYGIVTTLPRACAQIRDNLRVAGLLDRCASIRALDRGVLGVDADREETQRRFIQVAARVIDDGAEVICLGSTAFTGMAERLTGELELPVVDGIAAAVQLVESCHRLGLRTSKYLTWAPPRSKVRTGWPVSALQAGSQG
jgi:allantoin racemase